MPSMSTVGDKKKTIKQSATLEPNSAFCPRSPGRIYDPESLTSLPQGWEPPGRSRSPQPLNGDLLVVLESCPFG